MTEVHSGTDCFFSPTVDFSGSVIMGYGRVGNGGCICFRITTAFFVPQWRNRVHPELEQLMLCHNCFLIVHTSHWDRLHHAAVFTLQIRTSLWDTACLLCSYNHFFHFIIFSNLFLKHQLQLDNDISCWSQVRLIVCWGMAFSSSWRAALRSLRFWGVGLRPSTRRLSWRFSMGFKSGESASHSIWGTPASSSHSLKDETRPVLFMQRHDDWINVIQVVLACHRNIHKVEGNSVATRHTYPDCNTTTCKGSSGDNSGWCIAFIFMSPTALMAITSAQWESTFNREQDWGPLVPHLAF